MPTGVHVSVDLSAVKAAIDDLDQRQVPYIASLALNATVDQVVKAEQETMQEVFDRPTPWTLNSMAIVPSNKSQGDTLTAEVTWREFAGKGVPAWKYLEPEIGGGARRRKSHELRLLEAGIMHGSEYAVPGAAVPLDEYGNMPASLITQILAQVSASFDPFSRQTARSKVRRVARGGAIYFVRREAGAPAGIYRRDGRHIRPMIIFVRVPLYGPRFPAYARAQEVVAASFEPNFWRAWAQQAAGFRR